MRRFLIALCACGGATTVPPTRKAVPTKRVLAPGERVDIIAELAKPRDQAAWLVPGAAQLVLGKAGLQAAVGAEELAVDLLEEQGNDVRVGVRLKNARFAVWTQRARMLGVITHDITVSQPGAPIGSTPVVVLHAGAHVRRLARQAERTQVRYVGALEVEGWVGSDAVADRGPADRANHSRVFGKRQLVIAGAVIRSEPKWTAHQLAVVNKSYYVEVVTAVDDAWSEVAYDDDEITVRGYLSKRDPPGRIHRPPQPEATIPITPNATAQSRTCLFVDNEAVGFLDAAQPVALERGRRIGWWTLTIDTEPWGAVAFDAKGPVETELETCGQ